jgi:hypothetical protein
VPYVQFGGHVRIPELEGSYSVCSRGLQTREEEESLSPRESQRFSQRKSQREIESQRGGRPVSSYRLRRQGLQLQDKDERKGGPQAASVVVGPAVELIAWSSVVQEIQERTGELCLGTVRREQLRTVGLSAVLYEGVRYSGALDFLGVSCMGATRWGEVSWSLERCATRGLERGRGREDPGGGLERGRGREDPGGGVSAAGAGARTPAGA